MHFSELILYVFDSLEGENVVDWEEFLNSHEYLDFYNDELLEIIQNLVNQHSNSISVHLNIEEDPNFRLYTGYIRTSNNEKIYFECEDELF
jgi:hypothetical protein